MYICRFLRLQGLVHSIIVHSQYDYATCKLCEIMDYIAPLTFMNGEKYILSLIVNFTIRNKSKPKKQFLFKKKTQKRFGRKNWNLVWIIIIYYLNEAPDISQKGRGGSIPNQKTAIEKKLPFVNFEFYYWTKKIKTKKHLKKNWKTVWDERLKLGPNAFWLILIYYKSYINISQKGVRTPSISQKGVRFQFHSKACNTHSL